MPGFMVESEARGQPTQKWNALFIYKYNMWLKHRYTRAEFSTWQLQYHDWTGNAFVQCTTHSTATKFNTIIGNFDFQDFSL